MGKIKHDDSDQEMDVQQKNNNQMDLESINKIVKKNKKISKNKLTSTNDKNKSSQLSSSKKVVRNLSKIVNLKKKERSLDEKQQIFKKVVKGLHGKSASKKQRKKSRVLMRKQLQKALFEQDKPQPKAAFSTMQSEKSFVQRKKKQPINQKVQVLKMRSVMGQSISSLKNMLAKKLL